MKPKTLILLGVAITCGLGASYMTSRLLAERQVESDKVKILVARKDLSMGDVIKSPDWFEEKELPREAVPPDAIDNYDKLKDRMIKHSRRPGDTVRLDDLWGDKDVPGLVGQIPHGYRAIGIRVAPEDIAAGFASLPLSKVDILSTVRRGDDKSSYAQVLLEDVLVVAADTHTNRDEQGRAMPASVVTVAVKPSDALKLRLAASMGSLSLVLRKHRDTSRAEDAVITGEEIKGGRRSEVEPELTASSAPPPPHVSAPTPAPTTVAQADPQGRRHRLTIYEGENARGTDFLLDDHNQVITPLEVTRTELNGSAPPPATQPVTPPGPPRNNPPAPGTPSTTPPTAPPAGAPSQPE